MSKLLTTLTAGALALGLSCAAFAADQEQGQSQDPKDKEYIVALKKCDSLQGAAKQQCLEDVNKKFGRM